MTISGFDRAISELSIYVHIMIEQFSSRKSKVSHVSEQSMPSLRSELLVVDGMRIEREVPTPRDWIHRSVDEVWVPSGHASGRTAAMCCASVYFIITSRATVV